MIQKVVISNFYSIREPLEVSFEASKEKQYSEDWIVQIGNTRLLKALLLYGANGSGKTNILYALDFLRHTVLKVPMWVDEEIPYMRFALDPSCDNADTTFDLYFFIGSVRYRYIISLSPIHISQEELRIYHNGNSSKAVYTRKYNCEKGVNVVRFGSWLNLPSKDRKTIEESTTNNITVLSAFASKNLSCTELAKVRDYFKYNFFRLCYMQGASQEIFGTLKNDPKLKVLLVDMIRAFHSNIIDIRVDEEVRQIPEETRQILMQLKPSEKEREQIERMQTMTTLTGQFIHKTDLGEFALEDKLQSEGIMSFIRCLVLLYEAVQKNKLVALDEFGIGLQAKIQHLLLDFFLRFSRNSQIIIASQSLGLLDFQRMRRDAIMIVSKDNMGQSKLDSITVRNIHKNIKLRKAYIDGRFKSIDPNEPDIDLANEYAKYHSLIFGSKMEGGENGINT